MVALWEGTAGASLPMPTPEGCRVGSLQWLMLPELQTQRLVEKAPFTSFLTFDL